MASVLSRTPANCRLHPRALGHAEIGTLADHLAAKFGATDADRIVGAVAHRFIGFGRGADVSADAAEEQQIGRRLENRLHQVLRPYAFGHTQQLTRFRAEVNLLRRARKNPAAFRDQRFVVVLPARARQLEQPLALGEAFFRVGIGIDENVAVVEGRHQLGGGLAQHAVAEDVARHVADADRGERRLVDIDIHLAEMTLDRFPGAAGGDAHDLVVVTGRAAGGEGIVQPEIVRQRNLVGDVGEGGGALVGGNHQIIIVAVVAYDVFRRHDAAVGIDIVGEVEQRRDE